MHHNYYIDNEGKKDGPHDLIAIMRRIRTQRIRADSYLYVDDSPDRFAARDIPEIALFFDSTAKSTSPTAMNAPSTWTLIRLGWEFTIEHNVMTVYAGAMLLLCLLMLMELASVANLMLGGMAIWCVFILMQNIYLVFVLRLYRGQTLGSDFINRQFAPALPRLVFASLMLAAMMAGGWILLFVPGLLVATLYCFVPFLMMDRRYGPIEAMHASRLLMQKYGRSYFPPACLLILLYLLCVALIVPMPLVLPIFAAAMSHLYEELSA
jgi:hypothetical protein